MEILNGLTGQDVGIHKLMQAGEIRGWGRGNAIDLVGLIENVSVYEAAKRLDEWFPANGNPVTMQATTETPRVSGNIPANGNTPLTFTLKDVNP
jgi:hypothetical protein